MRAEADVIIIGGGVVGCAIAWHLAKAGVRDVLLLERTELTAGSTWHAAGGCGTFGGGANAAWLHKYAFELYPTLEAETGQSCGFHHVGEIAIARTDDRIDEMRRHIALAKRNEVDVFWLSPEELGEKAPILDPATIKAAIFEPSYGHVSPSDVTGAFATGARTGGVEIRRQTPVIETNQRPDLSWDVVTPAGTVHAQRIVNAAGLWAREVAALAGVAMPVMPVEHHYFVTDEIATVAALARELPLIGDADAEYYMRQEGKGLLLGVYEDSCTHWAEGGTPADFGHELLPDALERIERNLAQAVESVPCLAEGGVKRVINGPITFSPDLAPLIGPVPGVANYWAACGVMSGFSQAAGIGHVLAGWMTEGEPPLDIFAWDIARFGPWAGPDYVKARTGDAYATRFQTVYPYEHRSAGRPVRKTPATDIHMAQRAVFGASDGLEFPLWYAPEGMASEDTLTFRRPNWHGPIGEECRRLATGVGIVDISLYGKHAVTGPGAHAWLDRMMAGRIPTLDGRLSLTPMLDHRGRLIGEFSVLRLGDGDYRLFGSGAADRLHHRHWERHLPAEGVEVRSLTADLCGLSVSGPRARQLLQQLSGVDLSREALPYARGTRAEVGPAKDAILIRVAYTGELGFEIWCDSEAHAALLLMLLETGADLGASPVGIRAFDSLRIEKGYGAWGLEYGPDYTPFEAGMNRLVRLDKGDFVGRDAALAARDAPLRYAYRLFRIETARTGDGVEPWGGEPIETDGRVVGYLSSAAFGHRVGACLGIGYLTGDDIDRRDGLTVDVLGEPRSVTVLHRPAYDPEGTRMRG